MEEEGVDYADALEHLHFDWHFWARTNQLEPSEYYFVWFCMCGRGWGKTRTGAEVVRSWAEDGVELMAIVAETPGDARVSPRNTKTASPGSRSCSSSNQVVKLSCI